MIAAAASVVLFAVALFSGGEFVDGRLFSTEAECNDAIVYAKSVVPDDFEIRGCVEVTFAAK